MAAKDRANNLRLAVAIVAPENPPSSPGRIDIVVVYKIDRLTRSLADFAKSAVYKQNQWLTVSNLAKSYRSISNTYIGECLT